ncbi:aminodeoxychorismate synthase component I [Paraglaciecola chathamensis]|uniref:aminodeoxychorismate synthase component I n=1 Tax=Paraglaciecola chathamensis TaxID=368405 RepID=UPI0026FE8D49|nr:aminodeoxychorismate synthase component I [Paraglaciecola chathamensis]MDO6559955.1 aminodeoxychorismate synthase component I [Paraglaciecola chathamensis]
MRVLGNYQTIEHAKLNGNSALPTLTITPLTTTKNPSMSHLFQHFSKQDWAILLDSADSTHIDGRYDMMVANPIATLVTKGNSTQICYPLQPQNNDLSHSDPMSLVQTVLEQCLGKHTDLEQTPSGNSSSLPFKAGAMGYFGYDLGRRFEDLPQQAMDPYLAPDMAVGIYHWAVIKDNHTQQFYLCHFPIAQTDNAPTAAELNALLEDSDENDTGLAETFTLNGQWQSNMEQSQYVKKIDTINAYLHSGDCYQVNLAQRFDAPYTGDEFQAYLRLRRANKAPFSAFIRVPEAVIISISPERFLSVDRQGKVQTKPIKGTRPRSSDKALDQQNIQALQQSSKDQAENLMIVDLLRNDLSKSCEPHSVDVPALFEIESFAAVHHLVSTVTGQLAEEHTPLSLLRGAFPGGSITGAPKIRAMQIIEELEPHRRNIYCGSIGYLGIDGDMDTSICIRTLLLEDSHLYCWAGGGIVLDSLPLDEYQESLDKVCKILPVLMEGNA